MLLRKPAAQQQLWFNRFQLWEEAALLLGQLRHLQMPLLVGSLMRWLPNYIGSLWDRHRLSLQGNKVS